MLIVKQTTCGERDQYYNKLLKNKGKRIVNWQKTCFVNRYVFVQVRVHYLAHDDILAGVVNLIKKLKIKRIIIGSRSDLKST